MPVFFPGEPRCVLTSSISNEHETPASIDRQPGRHAKIPLSFSQTRPFHWKPPPHLQEAKLPPFLQIGEYGGLSWRRFVMKEPLVVSFFPLEDTLCFTTFAFRRTPTFRGAFLLLRGQVPPPLFLVRSVRSPQAAGYFLVHTPPSGALEFSFQTAFPA